MSKAGLTKNQQNLYDLMSAISEEHWCHFISEQQKKEDEIFISALRTMAEPPIKGEITKGKVKWRGIRIVQYNDGLKCIKWLEQKGKQISPKIIFTVSIGNGREN